MATETFKSKHLDSIVQLNDKIMNSIEHEIDNISIVGRYAFGLSIIEKFAFEKDISLESIGNLKEVLYEFLNLKSLDHWETKVSEIIPSNIIDQHSENTSEEYELSKTEFHDLKLTYKLLPKELIELINNTLGLGTSNLYCGFNNSFTKEYVIDLIQMNNEYLQKPINFSYFKKFELIKGKEWGEKILHSEIKNGW